MSHPTPPEIWVEEGRAHLIRRRGKYRDFFEDLCDLSCEKNRLSATREKRTVSDRQISVRVQKPVDKTTSPFVGPGQGHACCLSGVEI